MTRPEFVSDFVDTSLPEIKISRVSCFATSLPLPVFLVILLSYLLPNPSPIRVDS